MRRFVGIGAVLVALCALAATASIPANAGTADPNGWTWTQDGLDTARGIADALQQAPLGANPTETEIQQLAIRLRNVPGLGTTEGASDARAIAGLVDDLSAYINLHGGDPQLSLSEAQSLLDSLTKVESVPPSVAPWDAGNAWDYVRGLEPPVSPPAVLDGVNPVTQTVADGLVTAQQDLGMLETVGGASTLGGDGTIAAVAALDMIPGDLIAYGVTVVIAFKLANGYFMRYAVPMPAMPTSADVTVAMSGVPSSVGGRLLSFTYHDPNAAQYGVSDGVTRVADSADCANVAAVLGYWYECNAPAPSTSDPHQADDELFQAFGDSAAVTGSTSVHVLPDATPAGVTVRYYGRSIFPDAGAVPQLMPPSYDPATEGAVVVPLDNSGLNTVPYPWRNPPVDPTTADGAAKVRASITPALAPFVDAGADHNRPVDPSTGAGGAPVPGGSSAGGSWTMPACRGLSYQGCYGAIVTAAPADVVVHPKEAAAYDPSIDVGSVVSTDPGEGATTRREVYVVTNPAQPTFVLPKPEPNEAYPDYLARLQSLGYVGTVTTELLDPLLADPLTGPDGVVRVKAPGQTFTRTSWPVPGPSLPLNVPLTIVRNPSGVPQAPPDPSGDPQPQPNPLPTPDPGPDPPPGDPPPPNPPPPDPPPPPPGGLDFTPLNIDFGCKFPFGFVCYAKQVTAWFNVAPIAPDFNIPVHVHTAFIDWQNHYDVDLAKVGTSTGSLTSPTSLSDYMAVLRALMSVALWVGAVYLIATKLLGFGAAGDPGEAVDEGMPW